MTNALSPVRNPIVTVKNGQAFANSRDVAAFFGKQHAHVMRDIDALVAADVSSFGETPWHSPQNDQIYRSFDMTKDGFTLLAMGFTGSKALEFKLAYIAAFNELEAKANAAVMALPDFTNPAAAARAWADDLRGAGLSSCGVPCPFFQKEGLV